MPVDLTDEIIVRVINKPDEDPVLPAEEQLPRGRTTRITVAEFGALLGQYALLRDEKSDGTDGGTFTSGDWRTRDLNTEVVDEIGITLSSNQFTLPAGKYRITARAPAITVNAHQLRLRNITDTVDTIVGASAKNGVAQISTDATLEGQFTITESKTFELQHQAQITRATNGFGGATSFGLNEVYATVQLLKVG